MNSAPKKPIFSLTKKKPSSSVWMSSTERPVPHLKGRIRRLKIWVENAKLTMKATTKPMTQ